MKKFLIAGNWKMNNTIFEAETLVTKIINNVTNISKEDLTNIKILVCPAFINLHKVTIITSGTPILVGAQNCYSELKGAFTGEVSPNMLKAVGCQYCIVGHSERRTILNETNSFINAKIKTLIEKDITPILCIGETLEQRQTGNTFNILKEQINNCLINIDSDDIAKIVIAYEPIWAIGTGISATSKEIEETHNWIRDHFINNYGDFIANKILLLYGGSMNEQNAAEILNINNVNGGLIGGASLIADKFISIINTAIKITKEKGHKPPCNCGCN